MKIAPTGERILVEMEELQDRKIGKIYVTDSSSETSRICKIVELGAGINGDYQIGDRLLISAYSGINLDCKTLGYIGDKLKIIVKSEILARIVE